MRSILRNRLAWLCLGIFLGAMAGHRLRPNPATMPLLPPQGQIAAAEDLLFVDTSIRDLYGEERILEILRRPGTVEIFRKTEEEEPTFDFAGHRFSNRAELLDGMRKASLCRALLAVNSFKVGLGTLCVPDPDCLIRIHAAEGNDRIEFLPCRRCQLIDWSFNGAPVGNAGAPRLGLSELGKTVIGTLLDETTH